VLVSLSGVALAAVRLLKRPGGRLLDLLMDGLRYNPSSRNNPT